MPTSGGGVKARALKAKVGQLGKRTGRTQERLLAHNTTLAAVYREPQ